MSYILKGKRIYSADGVIENGEVTVDRGYIKDISKSSNTEAAEGTKLIDLSAYNILPGFIDIHVHGGNGYDTMDGNIEAINAIARYKLREGVTAFCPATVTAPLNVTQNIIKTVRRVMGSKTNGARIMGLFLEGPYISEQYKGAHKAEYIRPVIFHEIQSLIENNKDVIKSIAIAPEDLNAAKVIEMLTEQGINVRLGHTAADYDTMNKAINLGGNIAIHTFNAMSPFTHRKPGAVGAILDNDKVYAEIICDFVHTHPAAVKMLYRLKGYQKTILITDCMMAGGLCDGNYKLGELDVTVKDSVATTAGGALAGSTLNMASAVKNIISLGIPMDEAVKMASETPAIALGIFNETGSIATGKKADIIAVDDDLNIKLVMVDGEVMDL